MAAQSASRTEELSRKKGAERRAVFQLLGLGMLLEICYLALYPLLAAGPQANDPVRQALPGIFPWLPRLYWTNILSPQLLARVPWLASAGSTSGNANLLLLLCVLATIVSLLAAWLGSRVLRVEQEYLPPLVPNVRAFFWIVLGLTTIFSVTMLCAPAALGVSSQDMLLYGLYGRNIVVYHANPYIVAPASSDPLHSLVASLQGQNIPVTTSGPIWIDLSILVTLFAHDNIALMLIGFRLLGFVAHLVNAILIWTILGKLKPETRLAATLLYAWNPLVLLFSISQMHQIVVALLFVLLAVHFFQHNSSILSWVFALLAVLINLSCILLLPLFFRILLHQIRFRSWGRRLLWWLGMFLITILFIALTSAPYWRGWGLVGYVMTLHQIFLPDNAANSLDAALMDLPIQLPAPAAWLIAPQHWALVMLVIEGIFLLFALWLADAVEQMLLCASALFLLLVILHPMYWPWSILLPLALA